MGYLLLRLYIYIAHGADTWMAHQYFPYAPTNTAKN
jgi:hypothetical protein